MSNKVLPILNTMMSIIGVKIGEIDTNMKTQIEKMIHQRNSLRAQKKFKDADELRNKIFELYDVELTDHSTYTSWKKKEFVELDAK